MTSLPHSFAYSYRLVKKCFLKIFETSKSHNFLIFQPIFIRFSLLCLKFFTLSSCIKLNLLWISSLKSEDTPSPYTWYRKNGGKLQGKRCRSPCPPPPPPRMTCTSSFKTPQLQTQIMRTPLLPRISFFQVMRGRKICIHWSSVHTGCDGD